MKSSNPLWPKIDFMFFFIYFLFRMPIKQKKTFIVGDIHGCFKEFLDLLKKANYHPERHRLILTGDMINRGPDSLKVLEWVKKHKVSAVRGNHEQLFIKRYFISPALKKLKTEMGKDLDQWMIWLNQLPFYIEEKDFLVVHAGLAPHKHPKQSDPHLLMHIRTWDGKGLNLKDPNNPPWYDFYKKKKLVVYGHWAAQGLTVKENSIGLDTGCVYGGELSGLLLPEKKILQVPARKSYYKF